VVSTPSLMVGQALLPGSWICVRCGMQLGWTIRSGRVARGGSRQRTCIETPQYSSGAMSKNRFPPAARGAGAAPFRSSMQGNGIALKVTTCYVLSRQTQTSRGAWLGTCNHHRTSSSASLLTLPMAKIHMKCNNSSYWFGWRERSGTKINDASGSSLWNRFKSVRKACHIYLPLNVTYYEEEKCKVNSCVRRSCSWLSHRLPAEANVAEALRHFIEGG
jgi:hypothetical protein